MLELTPAIILLPLAGSIVLGAFGRRLSPAAAGAVGAGSVGLAAVAAAIVAVAFSTAESDPAEATVTLWRWIEVGSFRPEISLHVDSLAIVMVLVVTVVGFLIHLYSIEYMAGDPDFSRFFSFMNLFVASMAALVLAGDLLFLYLGWEGVGLSSYLLIGFWYRDPANGRAARKAFIVTRIGDAVMAVGLFILFTRLGTLDIQEVLDGAPGLAPAAATAAALLLLGGAAGKSAQLPLHTWLPDAMAGPTPVSALIHAATMVTAGVYLIARMHAVFLASPAAMSAVAIAGAASLLVGAFSALVQRDIKRALAYSTMSQIGYMFLALGVGAWGAAMFHFVTHAFFKALLFLGAGAVILALHHEQDMHRMGGLRSRLPLVFWTFLIGAASLASLPLITAGFYSKDLILHEVWSASTGGPVFWAAGLLGALLTATYSFRIVFLVFFGEERTPVEHGPGKLVAIPLVVLAALGALGGFIPVPESLTTALPQPAAHAGGASEAVLQVVASAVSIGGAFLAWVLFARRRDVVERWRRSRPGAAAGRFLASGWGFDALYALLIVRPFVVLAKAWRSDPFDRIFTATARLVELGHLLVAETQTGRLRWYAFGVAAGAAALLAIGVLA